MDVRPTILVVDDEPQNRKLLEALLHPQGYLTVGAASGAEALAIVARHTPDLILLDVMMADMDGHEVTRRLKADPHSSNIPIILVTALSDREARLAGLQAGAEEFLSKPVDRAELWLRVRNLLRLKDYGDFLLYHQRLLEDTVQARTLELQRFRTAMDVTADAIFLISRSTMRFVEVNATASHMLGYSREELMQMGPAALSPSTPAELAGIYDALIGGHGGNRIGQTSIRRKDGSSLAVDVHRQVQFSGGDWIIVSVLRDITERQRAQQEILQLNAGLEERVRQRTGELLAANQELEAFSYSASHDLRTPLSAIDGYSSLLGKEIAKGEVSERSTHYLARIRAGVVQMGELIDALLQLAQVSRVSLSWEKVDLSAMAREVLDVYCEQTPGRELRADIQPDLLVQGDRRLLHQVMDNLIGNAWKFSGQEARTSIAVSGRCGDDGQQVYTVRDQGKGFDMAYADKLFGAFQRLHASAEFPGTGIGLATVRR
ncbi:MAG: response regulator, partial [Polaromonas sp.]|nr:response regulator [Polaromonas sp.]